VKLGRPYTKWASPFFPLLPWTSPAVPDLPPTQVAPPRSESGPEPIKLGGLLAGTRVLDLADESGVYGTKLLADLGAEVIRIEPPSGDPLRRMPPFAKDQVDAESSLYFTYMNTNKRSYNPRSGDARRPEAV